MKRINQNARAAALMLTLALLLSLPSPAAAWFGKNSDDQLYVLDFAKNGLVGSAISFSPDDFRPNREDAEPLTGITLSSLPDAGAGELTIAGQPVRSGDLVQTSALAGLRFQCASSPTHTTASFTFRPSFPTASCKRETTVTLYLLDQENHPPIARNMELSTYKNVAITGCFDAQDNEGDTLTFRLTSTPARGSVTLAEDGSGQFVYTPYENKTGSDSFTFVAEDPAGNTSPQATVSIRITKPDTKVTYADLEGHSAHKAAIHLAEEGIYVGACMDGRYFFDPERPVSRAQFLTMAMDCTHAKPMDGITLTGFHDDAAIPTWAKGPVSAALKAGVIRGSKDETGAPVFGAGQTISWGEATVMLNNLLDISDVPTEVFSPGNNGHWAAQAAANLTASGVIRPDETGAAALSQPLTMAEAAELLDGALDVMAVREHSWFNG